MCTLVPGPCRTLDWAPQLPSGSFFFVGFSAPIPILMPDLPRTASLDATPSPHLLSDRPLSSCCFTCRATSTQNVRHGWQAAGVRRSRAKTGQHGGRNHPSVPSRKGPCTLALGARTSQPELTHVWNSTATLCVISCRWVGAVGGRGCCDGVLLGAARPGVYVFWVWSGLGGRGVCCCRRRCQWALRPWLPALVVGYQVPREWGLEPGGQDTGVCLPGGPGGCVGEESLPGQQRTYLAGVLCLAGVHVPSQPHLRAVHACTMIAVWSTLEGLVRRLDVHRRVCYDPSPHALCVVVTVSAPCFSSSPWSWSTSPRRR
jgi:hypothetical protein